MSASSSSSAYTRGAAADAQGPDGLRQVPLVEHMAARLGRPLVTGPATTTRARWIWSAGTWSSGGETVWLDGPVTRAVREGAILYLDEIAEARATSSWSSTR
jgi:nitric oxide reductase NorQ protein